MAKKRSKFLLYCVCVWLCLSTSACGIRSTIQGQVVDAETGKPVEGAAMAIKWYEYKLVLPYASGYNQIETAEDLSDAEGFF